MKGNRALDNWDAYGEVGNLVRIIEDGAWGRLANGDELITYELVRMGHRQFPWQAKPNQRLIASYCRLYSNPRLTHLMHTTFGMTAIELFQIGVGLAGGFLARPALKLPLHNQINAVEPDIVARLVARFSTTLPDLKAEMQAQQRYDVNWAYVFDPMRSRPLIRLNDTTLFCPLPTLLFWRFTEALYFDLVQQGALFNDNFGLAFEDLAGEVVLKVAPAGRLQALPEQTYGSRKRPRKSVDWIVIDQTASLFVECKSSRLKSQAKADIVDTTTIDAEFDRLAGFLFQLYRTLSDALTGQYPHWKLDARPIYPVLLTLDEWLPSGQLLAPWLQDRLRIRLEADGVNPRLMHSHPFTLCSLHEFEALCKAMASNGVDAVMRGKTAEEERSWAVIPYLSKNFPSSLGGEALFQEEWDRIILKTRRIAAVHPEAGAYGGSAELTYPRLFR
jgi:hypothetical protein